MAAITPTILPTAANSLTAGASATLTGTTLGSSDTLDFQKDTGQILLLLNPTGGSISPVIDGLAVASVQLEGYGNRNVGVLTSFSIPAGAMKWLPLDTQYSFWTGTIQITSGAGLIAYLINKS